MLLKLHLFDPFSPIVPIPPKLSTSFWWKWKRKERSQEWRSANHGAWGRSLGSDESGSLCKLLGGQYWISLSGLHPHTYIAGGWDGAEWDQSPFSRGSGWSHLAACHSLFGSSTPSFLPAESGSFSWVISGNRSHCSQSHYSFGSYGADVLCQGRVEVSVSTKQTEHIPRSCGWINRRSFCLPPQGAKLCYVLIHRISTWTRMEWPRLWN